ncbi:DUF4350 domain-containing protein [Microbacterium deminutum]|uniref:DUF4350 domain-containing protein n=1 Tax=Microbacterium deminutum TaxID=344164 RepID=A0ABN2QA49_9MICO
MTTVAPPPTRRRSVLGWIAVGVVLLVVGGIGAALSGLGRWNERDALDPDSAGPLGARALAQILRQQGVEVIVARDRGTAAEELQAGATTLVLPDAPALSDGAILALTRRAADVVLIEPRSRTLDLLIPGSKAAGVAPADTVVQPECELAEAVRSGAVSTGAVYAPGDSSGMSSCYPAGGGFGVLVASSVAGGPADGRVAALDGRALLTNEILAENGNAALGLNLMGRHPTVVWYVPGIADTDLQNAHPSLGQLTPPWVSPVIVLLLIAGLAAAVWRGRRFGPLVTERLPVSVRAAETTEGRARLYARSRDALHAADQLRIPALARIGRALGLGAGSTAAEIADAAAARTGLDRAVVHGTLIHDIPRGDADLVAIDARLRHLEDAVHAAVRPERNPR